MCLLVSQPARSGLEQRIWKRFHIRWWDSGASQPLECNWFVFVFPNPVRAIPCGTTLPAPLLPPSRFLPSALSTMRGLATFSTQVFALLLSACLVHTAALPEAESNEATALEFYPEHRRLSERATPFNISIDELDDEYTPTNFASHISEVSAQENASHLSSLQTSASESTRASGPRCFTDIMNSNLWSSQQAGHYGLGVLPYLPLWWESSVRLPNEGAA